MIFYFSENDVDFDDNSGMYEWLFICPKCSEGVKVSRQNYCGKCQNSDCGEVGDFTRDVREIEKARSLFDLSMACLERGQIKKSLKMLKDCLAKRQSFLQKFDRDLAETHDAMAR